MQEFDHGDGAAVDGFSNLFIDEVIVEADGGGIGVRTSVIDASGASPIDRSQTHRTWFARSVDAAVAQLERLQMLASGANGDYFGVGSGVIAAGDAVPTFTDDFPVVNDDSAERPAGVGIDTSLGQLDRVAHESVVYLAEHLHHFNEQFSVFDESFSVRIVEPFEGKESTKRVLFRKFLACKY